MIPQYDAYAHLGAVEVAAYEDPLTHLRTIAAVGARYLVMAVSGSGVSAFQDPPPAVSWLDPWWLAAVPIAAFIGVRALRMLWRGSLEGAFWLAAAGAFAPVSQVFPFLHPVADRYLYFILPGLIGGCLLAGPPLLEAAASRVGGAIGSRGWQGIRIAVAVWIAVFAVRSFERAYVWKTPFTVMADVERNYPEGTAAKTNRATRAAQVGDAETAVALLREAHKRGYNRLDHLLMPSYGPIQDESSFVSLKQEWAREWIDRLTQNEDPSQLELQLIAQARIVEGDLVGARRDVERAIERGGPISERLHEDLRALDYQIRLSRLRK
jgi:hypothetical protein